MGQDKSLVEMGVRTSEQFRYIIPETFEWKTHPSQKNEIKIGNKDFFLHGDPFYLKKIYNRKVHNIPVLKEFPLLKHPAGTLKKLKSWNF